MRILITNDDGINAPGLKVLHDIATEIAGPDGEWIVEPCDGEEKLMVATIDHCRIREERQNFDPAGHYARPDVTHLTLNRNRQSTLKIVESQDAGEPTAQ